MKKVKLQFKYDELNAVYADLFNNAVPAAKRTSIGEKMISSLLVQLYTKIAQKVLFRTDKPIKLTLDVATACAFMLYANTDRIEPTDYLYHIHIRIVSEIDQQLA